MSLCVVGASANGETSHSDALRAFGVATGTEETTAEEMITRSAFVSMAVRMSGMDANLYSEYPDDFPFADVRADDIAFPYVRAAYEMGVINGNGDGHFYGQNPINIQQATKILVTLLGYKEKAEALGGYPHGYMKVGNEIDLYSGVDISASSEALGINTAYELVMNALESTFSLISAIGDSTEYAPSDKMYMSQTLDIYKIEGVVEQNEYTSLYGTSEISEGRIEIDGLILDVADTNAAEFIGQYVNCYFKEEDGKEKIIYIEANEAENRVLTLTSREVELSSSLSEIIYTEDGKDKKAKLQSDAILIRNGNMTTLSASTLFPTNGEITLISNDGDNVYDVVCVYDYRTVVAKVVSPIPGSVADSLGGQPLELDKYNLDYKFTILLDGEEIGVEDLAKNDVISYYETRGEVLTKKLIVSRNTVTGKIEGINDDTVIIDGAEYYVTDAFRSKISAGDMGSFYVDAFGCIADGKITDEISVYGFITGIRKDGLNGVKVKIFTENDRWVQLDVKSKITLNDAPASEDDLFTYFTETTTCNQLISYKVNSDAEVTSVKIALDCVANPSSAEAAIEADEFRLSQKVPSTQYRQYLSSLNNYLSVSAGVKIFFVPEDTSKEYEFYIGGKGNLVNNRTYTNVYSYNENKTRVTNLVVIRTSGGTSNSEFMIYDKTGRVIIDNEELPCLYGSYGAHGQTRVYVSEEKVLSDAGTLNKGDVIRFSFDKNGRASAITKVYDTSLGTSQKGLIGASAQLYSDATYISGIVTSVDTENMRFTLDYNAGVDALLGLNTYLKQISVYDISDEEVYVISPADLAEGDRIVSLCRQYQAQTIVVYRD